MHCIAKFSYCYDAPVLGASNSVPRMVWEPGCGTSLAIIDEYVHTQSCSKGPVIVSNINS